MLRAKECTPTLYPSIVSTFQIIVESIRELGGVSLFLLPSFIQFALDRQSDALHYLACLQIGLHIVNLHIACI
jgi:hypothetical protein